MDQVSASFDPDRLRPLAALRQAREAEASAAQSAGENGSAEKVGGTKGLVGEDGLTFGDLIDTLNPLHHIPGVGAVYRHLTGDQIDPAARLAGGTLFAGPIGLVSAAANIGVESETGKDLGGHAMAAMGFETGAEPETQVAQGEAMAEPAQSAPSPDGARDPNPSASLDQPTELSRAAAMGGSPFAAPYSPVAPVTALTTADPKPQPKAPPILPAAGPLSVSAATPLETAAPHDPAPAQATGRPAQQASDIPVVPANFLDLMMSSLDDYDALKLKVEGTAQ